MWNHGITGYTKWKCRCDICKEAKKSSRSPDQDRLRYHRDLDISRLRARKKYWSNPDKGRETAKKYRELNSEKIKQTRRNSYGQKDRERSLEYYYQNRSRINDRKKQYRDRNKEYIRAMNREKYHQEMSGVSAYRANMQYTTAEDLLVLSIGRGITATQVAELIERTPGSVRQRKSRILKGAKTK